MTDPHARFMRLAIQTARRGVRMGQTPFGAVIVRKGRVVCAEHNRVWLTTDSTAHAEVTAIRVACRKLRTIDLSGCVLYSTCEPCPMCFSAIHWARIDTIYHGTTIADARMLGFSELTVSDRTMKRLGKSPVRIVGGVSRRENLALFREFASRPGRRLY